MTMTAATASGFEGILWRRSASLRVTPAPTKKRSLAVTVLAATIAFTLTLTLASAGTASAATASFPETRVAAQTNLARAFVGAETPETPATVGANGVYGYDGMSGCCVAPSGTRVYSSGADALDGGAISLDDAVRVASENGIDMRAISLQYESGAPSNLYGFTSLDGAGNIVRAPEGRYIVTLTDAGLSSPGSALNTIAHELNHIREISRTPGFHISEEAGATLAGDLAELFRRGG